MKTTIAAIGLLVTLLLVAGCEKENEKKKQEPAVSKSRITSIVEGLRSEDKEVRWEALERLKAAKGGLTPEEVSEALRAAAEKWPDEDNVDGSWELVLNSLDKQPGHVAEVAELFPRFSYRARWVAVRYFAMVGNVEAARAYLDLVEQHTEKVPSASIWEFAGSAETRAVLLPELLKYAAAKNPGFAIQQFALHLAEQGLVKEADLAPLAEPLVQAYGALRDRQRAAEQSTGDDWMWTPEYFEVSSDVTLLLDFMGHVPGKVVTDALEQSLGSRDPEVKMYAVLGLVRRGYEVPPKTIEEVAASAANRQTFYYMLGEIGRRDLCPPQYATQEALAESRLVEWLCLPSELGRPPHEIAHMATFEDFEGKQRYYLFRFRMHKPDERSKDGWMAGVAGPYEVAAMPTIDGGDDTCSWFTKWGELTPGEHFEECAEMTTRWREVKAAEAMEQENKPAKQEAAE